MPLDDAIKAQFERADKHLDDAGALSRQSQGDADADDTLKGLESIRAAYWEAVQAARGFLALAEMLTRQLAEQRAAEQKRTQVFSE